MPTAHAAIDQLFPTTDDPAVPRLLRSAQARELVAALRASDPMRASFDTAVRRFVRAERAAGRGLDLIIAELSSVLQAHVEPTLPAPRRPALRNAVLWFAVSEYHRAD